jgi:hypothetical protein
MSGFVLLAAVVAVQTAASVATHNDSMIPSDEIRGSISQKDVCILPALAISLHPELEIYP